MAFPTIPCPLHVFEPRYRLMIRRSMETGTKQFGMCIADDLKGFADYGCMLQVRSWVLRLMWVWFPSFPISEHKYWFGILPRCAMWSFSPTAVLWSTPLAFQDSRSSATASATATTPPRSSTWRTKGYEDRSGLCRISQHTFFLDWIHEERCLKIQPLCTQVEAEELVELLKMHDSVYEQASSWFTSLKDNMKSQILSHFGNLPSKDLDPQVGLDRSQLKYRWDTSAASHCLKLQQDIFSLTFLCTCHPAGHSQRSCLVLVASCCSSIGKSCPAHHFSHDLTQRPPHRHPQSAHLCHTQKAAVIVQHLDTCVRGEQNWLELLGLWWTSDLCLSDFIDSFPDVLTPSLSSALFWFLETYLFTFVLTERFPAFLPVHLLPPPPRAASDGLWT